MSSDTPASGRRRVYTRQYRVTSTCTCSQTVGYGSRILDSCRLYGAPLCCPFLAFVSV